MTTKPKQRLNLDHVAWIVAEAAAHGDQQARQRFNVSARTLRRYRGMVAGNPELAAAVASKTKLLERDWARVAVTFLRSAISKLEALVSAATPKQIRAVAGAIKIVGDLQVVREALLVEQPEPDRPSSSTPPDEAGGGETTPAGSNGHAPAVH